VNAWTIADGEALKDLAGRLAPRLASYPAVLLLGDLGAGKTTFVQGLLRALGVTEPVKSPTFDLVHPYRGPDGRLLYHVDLFRLAEPPPPEALDVDEPSALVLVEWGAPWRPYYPRRVEITIQILPSGDRTITVEEIGAGEEQA
jgi:tRNA threonylcarbamoyl adenosine modification protein YjeE